MDFNENPYGCSSSVIRALQNLSANDIGMYPEYSTLLTKLAQYTGLVKENILLSNGSDDAIRILFQTYLQEGDQLLLCQPSFAMYEIYAQQRGANICSYEYSAKLELDVENFLTLITPQTKLIMLGNPNNPTGTCIPPKNLRQILEKAIKVAQCPVIVDEAYIEYVIYQEKDTPQLQYSAQSLLQEFSNLIILRTFSKVFGLAGMRIGYILSASKNITRFKGISSPYPVNSLALLAAEKALQDMDFVKETVFRIQRSKEYLQDQIATMGFQVFPSVTNFFIVNFGDKASMVYQNLKEMGILVRDRTKSPGLANCLRIGIGTEYQCSVFLTQLKNILSLSNYEKNLRRPSQKASDVVKKYNSNWRN